MTGPDVVERLEQAVDRVGLPSSIPDSAAPDDIMTYLASDKKVRHGRTRFVLLSEIGVVHSADGSWSSSCGRPDRVGPGQRLRPRE